MIIQTRACAPIDVPSPSFTLVQRYDTPSLAITHADLYRLSSVEDTDELALEDAIAEGCLLVEWPESAWEIFPADALLITILLTSPDQPNARQLAVTAPPGWQQRLTTVLAG